MSTNVVDAAEAVNAGPVDRPTGPPLTVGEADSRPATSPLISNPGQSAPRSVSAFAAKTFVVHYVSLADDSRPPWLIADWLFDGEPPCSLNPNARAVRLADVTLPANSPAIDSVIRAEVLRAHGEYDGSGAGRPAFCRVQSSHAAAIVLGEVNFVWATWPRYALPEDAADEVTAEGIARATGFTVGDVEAAIGYLQMLVD